MKTLQDRLKAHEETMRQDAYGIANIYAAMKDLNKEVAQKAINGIIEYLQEKAGNSLKIALLVDNKDNYDNGLLTTQEYEDNKNYILGK